MLKIKGPNLSFVSRDKESLYKAKVGLKCTQSFYCQPLCSLFHSRSGAAGLAFSSLSFSFTHGERVISVVFC